MSKLANVTTTVTKSINNNKKLLIIIVASIIGIIIIVAYLYYYFNKKKEENKKNKIYPGYYAPCPDYWTDISGDGTKTPGICHNPEKLGVCRVNTSIQYGDHIYLVNVTDKYINMNKDKIKKPLDINTDMSYNPDLTYLTLTNKPSSCSTNIDTSTIDDMSCYKKKNITNKIPYTQKKHATIFIRNVSGTLNNAKQICDEKEKLELPLDWNVWETPTFKEYNNKKTSSARKKEIEKNKDKIEDKLYNCSKNTINECLEEVMGGKGIDVWGAALPPKIYWQMGEGGRDSKWRISHPNKVTIPKGMKCKGIKKHHELFKLMYGYPHISKNNLIEGESDDTVWVKSFCENNLTHAVVNQLVPSNKSMWIFEQIKKGGSGTTDTITYYKDNKADIFYISNKDDETNEISYISVCDNNIVSAGEKIFISHPDTCDASHKSVLCSKEKHASKSQWIFYKHTNKNNVESDTLGLPPKPNKPPSVHNTDYVYIGSMYKYDSVNKRPKYFLSTCGSNLHNKHLQLVEFKDIANNTYNNQWSFIIKKTTKNNPIITNINLNDVLGLDIEKNNDVANNKHNLHKKCAWAKTCDVTWDVVDKLC